MKNAALSLAALLALAPAALPQDAPPPAAPPAAKPADKPAAPARHENKVTAAAKAAFDAMQKLMASPVAKGLQNFTGTIEMKMEMGEGGGGDEMGGMPAMGMSFSLVFKAPDDLKVTGKGGEMFGPQGSEGMTKGVRGLVLNTMGVYMPVGDDEFDADVVTEDGKKVIVLSTYEKGVPQGSVRIVLGDSGLPASGSIVTKQEMMGKTVEQKAKISWVFAKDGDLYRMEKQIIETPMAPAPFEYRISYAEAGGFSMPTKFVMDMGMMKMGYRFTELTVNGKKVEIAPEAKKPAPAATPAAPPGPPKKDGGAVKKPGDHEGNGEGKEDDGDEDDDEKDGKEHDGNK